MKKLYAIKKGSVLILGLILSCGMANSTSAMYNSKNHFVDTKSNPISKKNVWTLEKQNKLIDIYDFYKRKHNRELSTEDWNKIGFEFGGEFSGIQCKNRYYQIQKTDNFQKSLEEVLNISSKQLASALQLKSVFSKPEQESTEIEFVNQEAKHNISFDE